MMNWETYDHQVSNSVRKAEYKPRPGTVCGACSKLAFGFIQLPSGEAVPWCNVEEVESAGVSQEYLYKKYYGLE